MSQGSVTAATFYVDNIVAFKDNGLIVESVEILDSRHIMVTCDQKLNFYSARDVDTHLLEDNDGNEITLTDNIGLRSWVTGFSNEVPQVRHYIYLETIGDLISGSNYTYTCSVRNEVLLLPESNTVSFSFNDETDISSSIKINQMGYLPESLKYAYVGNYLGDAGEMPVSTNIAYLKNTNGITVATNTMAKRTEDDLFWDHGVEMPFCGEEVWIADFSSYTNPGTYYVQVPGIGRSYEFEIAEDVYNSVYYHTARAFYYQRSGCAIETNYAGIWSRPISHTNLSFYHNSVQDMSGELYDTNSEPAIGETIDLTGGWYDAADYNKYTQSGADAVNCILSIYELAPEKFSCDTLNIPESGNGIPDIIDQVKWEIDWLAKMVSANGAVFNKCTFPGFAFVMPQARTNETDQMWAITKTTRDTALACGALAKAARIFGENNWYSADVATWSNKAELAWQCLQTHTNTYPVPQEGEDLDDYQNPTGDGTNINGDHIPDINTGPYYEEAEDHKERVWAALEMYNLTGSQTCYSNFYELVDSESSASFIDDLENLVVSDWWVPASNPMRLYSAMEIDSQHAGAVEDGLDRVIAAYQQGYNNWRYKVSAKNTLTSLNYGGFSMSTRWTVYYILFYELLGDSDLLELAKQNLDVQLGANPLSTTYITGIGDRSPLHPHCKISEYDGIETPVPGFTVYGVAHSLRYDKYYTIIDNAWPPYQGIDPAFDYYPTTRKYVDAWEPVKMGEYVIDNMARTVMSFGYFSSPTNSYQP